jgi:hypothetical protein
MDRLRMLVLIVAMMGSCYAQMPTLTSTNVSCDMAFAPGSGLSGTYFQQKLWLFYSNIPDQTRYGSSEVWDMRYKTCSRNTDGSLAVSSEVKLGFMGHINTACCVYDDVLLLFYSDDSGKACFRSLDGVNVSDPKYLPNWTDGSVAGSAVNNMSVYSLAAMNFHDTLCVAVALKSSVAKWDGAIILLSSVDGVNWKNATSGVVDVSQCAVRWSDWPLQTSATLSMCAFETNTGREDMFICCSEKGSDCLMGLMCSDLQPNCYGRTRLAGMNPITTSCAIGSAKGASSGYKISIICKGIKSAMDKINPDYFVTFDIDAFPDNWYGWTINGKLPQETASKYNITCPTIIVPFPYSVINADQSHYDLMKELFIAQPVVVTKTHQEDYGEIYYAGPRIAARRAQSDKYIFETSINHDFQDHPDMWTHIGTIEGPPPYVLNGEDISSLKDHPSKMSFGTGQTISSGQSSCYSVSTKVEHSFGEIAEVSVEAALKNKSATKTDTTVSHEITVYPMKNATSGYHLFLKPNMWLNRYRIKDWADSDLNRRAYVPQVSNPVLFLYEYDLTKVDGACNPHSLVSYINRKYDPNMCGQIIPPVDIQWVEGVESQNQVKIETEKSTTKTKSIKVHAKAFDVVSVNYGYEYVTTVGTTLSKDVTCILDSPESSEAGDTTGFTGKFYWITPSPTATNWWLPDTSQSGWCITYTVNPGSVSIRTENAVLNADPALSPAGFRVHPLYPNPVRQISTVRYEVPAAATAHIEIFDNMGRTVRMYDQRHDHPGSYLVQIDASNLPAGTYHCRIKAGQWSGLRTFVVAR